VGTFILVFVVFGAIHKAAPGGFAGLAIGMAVFAAIIPVAPATGASINPARTLGPMLVQQIAGGTVHWGQLPVYLLAEFAGGLAAGFLYGAIATDDILAPPRRSRRPGEPLGGHEEFINAPGGTEALAGVVAGTRSRSPPTRYSSGRPMEAGLLPAAGHRAAARRLVAPVLDAAPGRGVHSPCRTRFAATSVSTAAGVVHIVKNYTGDVQLPDGRRTGQRRRGPGRRCW
jgi:hypothetical protein